MAIYFTDYYFFVEIAFGHLILAFSPLDGAEMEARHSQLVLFVEIYSWNDGQLAARLHRAGGGAQV